MKDLTTGNERKLIIQFAVPMLIGSLFQQLYNVVDSLVVGNFLGKEALAAVGVSYPVIFALVSLLIGLTIGLSVIVGQYFGAKNYEKVREAADTIYIFLFFASLVFSAAGLIFSGDIMRLMNIPDAYYHEAKLYFEIFAAGFVFLFGFNATNAILRGLGDTKTPLIFLIISTLLNLVLDVLFVAGFGWGIGSVAFATVFSQFIAFVLAIWHINRKHQIIRFSITKMKFNPLIFKQGLKIGVPSGLQQSFVAMGMMALVVIVNGYGADAMAAFSVGSRIDSFAAMPGMILASALSNFVAQNMGAHKIDRVKKGFRVTLSMVVVVSGIISAILIVFRHELIWAFNQDPEVVRIGAEYLLITGFFYIIFSSMFVVQSVLRGAGDAITPMFISLFALWIGRVPLSWYLSQIYGTEGIWWGIPLAWCLGFALSYFFYKRGKWKSKSITKPIEIPEDIV